MSSSSALAPRPRGRQSTFTDEQREFLDPFQEPYNDPDSGRVKGEEFWKPIIPVFYTHWPLPEPVVDYSQCKTEEERKAARDKVIKNQMRTARERIKSYFARSAAKSNKQDVWKRQLRRSMCPEKSKPRPFTERTMFKFYGGMDEYKDAVEDRRDELLAESGQTQRTRADNVVNWCKAAREFWEKESEDVREVVLEAAANDYQKRFDAWEHGYDPDTMTEDNREEARDNLAGAVKPLIGEVCRIAGFTSGMFIGGLPASERHPRVTCFDVHYGKSLSGLEYHQFDNPAFRTMILSFATFTDSTVERTGGAPAEGRAQTGPADLPMTMLPFADEAGAEGGSDISDQRGMRPSTSTRTATPTRPSTSTRPTPSAHPSTSTRPAPRRATARGTIDAASASASSASASPAADSASAELNVDETMGAAATSPSSTTPAPDPSPPTTETAPSTAPARRPKPKPVAYDVAANFSNFLVKEFTLNNAFRALLQRMPASARKGRLVIMDRWQVGSLKRANSLAQQDAELGPPTPARDKATLKEIFKSWEDRPRRPISDVPPAASKRKLSAREDDEADYESETGEDVAPAPRRRSARFSSKGTVATSSLAQATQLASGAPAAPSSSRTRRPPSVVGHADGSLASAGADGHPAPRVGEEDDARSQTSERDVDMHDGTHHGQLSDRPEDGVDAQVQPDVDMFHDTRNHQQVALEDDAKVDVPAQSDVNTHADPHGLHPSADADGAPEQQQLDNIDRAPGASDADNANSAGHGADSIFDAEVRKRLPAWFGKCYNNVSELVGGEDLEEYKDARASYTEIVRLWGAIEATRGYSPIGKALTSRHRPAFVTAWIQRARVPTHVPDLLADRKPGETDDEAANIAYDRFRSDLTSWWHGLNPKWRTASQPTPTFALNRSEGDWSSLFCTGQNGLVSVIKCLKWRWDLLCEVDEQEDDRAQWSIAVKDVAWVFEQILKQLLSSSESMEEPPAKRRRT